MKRRCGPRNRGLILLVLLLLLCGCSAGGDQDALLRDDFEDLDSGWGADEQDESDRGYEDGEYFIHVKKPDWFAWANPGARFADARVEVDAYLASGDSGCHFGVICRHADLKNFYYFAVSADGYYAIFRRVRGGELEVLTGGGKGMVRSPAIETDGEENHIVAVCQGENLSLYVNGELLATVTDDSHRRGDVGLGVGSGSVGKALVHFDDLVVTEP